MIWWVVVALLALVVSGVVSDDGGVLDELGDAIVNLTTSDEARLQKLELTTQLQVRSLLEQLAADGIGVHVGQTLRTPAEEKQAIDSGHSGVKTHSWHELGRAVDLYPLDDNGQAILNPNDEQLDLFRRMHARAVEMGFRSLAFNSDGSKHLIHNNAGKAIWDGGHIEWRQPYGSIAEAVNAEGEGFGIA